MKTRLSAILVTEEHVLGESVGLADSDVNLLLIVWSTLRKDITHE